MKTDDAFIADLSASRSRVSLFASTQRALGIDIWQHPDVVRPDAESRGEFADAGDLMMMVRVEHKVRDFSFSSPDDFKYPTIIVDECYKVDRIPSSNFVYVIESSDGKCAAVVSSRSRQKWTKARRYDPAQRRECEFYEVPVTAVRFSKIEEVFR